METWSWMAEYTQPKGATVKTDWPYESPGVNGLGQEEEKAVRNVWRLSEYGLPLSHNIGTLVQKVPLSPAGNPWSLPQNAGSVREYGEGACPQSDALFARSILITIPSRLTRAQEKEMAEAIRASIAGATTP